MDDYFLTPDLRTPERLAETGGNVDSLRFKKEILDGIASGIKFEYRSYDCEEMRLKPPVTVIPKRLNIIEGSYSMHPIFSEQYHMKVFLSVSVTEQRKRIEKRNDPEMQERFFTEWIPMEDRYFLEMNIRNKCDIVIEG